MPWGFFEINSFFIKMQLFVEIFYILYLLKLAKFDKIC